MTVIDFILSNQEYQRDLIARSVYHSNAIEANTMTFEETYNIMYNNDFSHSWGHDVAEVDAIVNHGNAIEEIIERIKKGKGLDEKFIRKLDEIMTKNISNVKGYRKTITLIKGSTYVPPPPERIPMLMLYFVDEYNKDTSSPYLKAAKFHMEFEKTHPFEDGTGRVGRMLINFELLRNNLPAIVIEDEDKDKYFEFLRTFDEYGFATWLEELSKKERQIMEKFGYVG